MEQQLISNMNSITSIDEDAYIMVATNGLLGEKYLKVVPGGGLNYLKRGDTISNTQGTMDLEDLLVNLLLVVAQVKLPLVHPQQKKKLLQVLTAVHSRHLLSKRLFEGVVPGEYVV
jgi:ABC-type transporter Mla subunit MlaD